MHHVNYLKVEKYLREHFDPDTRSTIYLIVVLQEETESANALKMIQTLHLQQVKKTHLPKYERDIYRKRGTKHQMDDLNFDKEDFIVLEGSSLIDAPLADILAEHHLTKATVTSVVRELDLTQKPKIVIKNDTYDIYGYCDLPKQTYSPLVEVKENVKRLILKTDNHTADDLSVKLKKSLIRR